VLSALFSSDKEHVGWLEPDRFVFDTAMLPVAFMAQEQAWSMQTSVWLGPCYDMHLFDTQGRPVAWTLGLPVMDRGVPLPRFKWLKPVNPVRPVRPVTPRRPLAVPVAARGWSDLSFQQWLATGMPVVMNTRTVENDKAKAEPSVSEAKPADTGDHQ